LRINQIKEFVRDTVELAKKGQRTPVIKIEGPPGVGKSQAIQQVANEMGIGYVDMRLALMDPTDVSGIPERVDGIMRWTRPEFIPTSGVGIIAWEELNRAPQDVRQCVFQVLTEWKLHTHKVPHTWIQVVLTNPDGGSYQVEAVDPAMQNRFVDIKANIDTDEWLKWARDNKLNDVIIRFVSAHPNLLSKIAEAGAFPSPRAYETMSRMIDNELIPQGCEFEVYAGTIGKEAGKAFFDFCQNQYKPITGKEVLNKYEQVKERIQNQREDEHMATSSDLLAILPKLRDELKAEQFSNLEKYILDLPNEYKIHVLKKIQAQSPTTLRALSKRPEIHKAIVEGIKA
jgi:hypothetical protein